MNHEEQVQEMAKQVAIHRHMLREQEKDIDGLGTRLEKGFDKLEKKIDTSAAETRGIVDDELKWIRRGLWATAVSFAALIFTIAVLIAQNGGS